MAEGGVLSFALGLETSGFAAALREGGAELWEFLGIVELGRKAMENFQSAFERGARLFNTGFATSTSVKTLYQFQEGVKGVGLAADDAQILSLKLQRSLSGIAETGERTAGAFALLHLNMSELRQLNPAEQFTQTVDALAKLDRSAQTGVASIIFGRGGAGQFLQIARQADDFKKSMQDAGKGGDVFASLASSFNRLLTTVDEIRSRIQVGWAAAARGFIIPLQQFLDLLKNFDYAAWGKKIGDAIAIGLELIREGKVFDLVAESFKFAIEMLGIYAIPVFEGFGYLLLKAFEVPLDYLQARLEQMADKLLGADPLKLFSLSPGLGVLQQLMGGQQKGAGDQEDFATIFERIRKEGVKFNFGTGEFGLGDIRADVAKRIAEANQAGDVARAEFLKKLQSLITTPPALPPKNPTGPQPGNDAAGSAVLPQYFKPTTTQFEKIGLVLNGGGASATDYARRTAVATERIAMAVTKSVTSLTRQPRHNSP